ncbi:MAG TPA: sodium:solute symporter, partial [Cytophagales bacterium]|nr:sodium:solute symporter [Cytophagales bacterium]
LFFPKQFIGGAVIALTMTGLDQEIMQKNLTCRNLGEAQKNMLWYSSLLVVVNLLFLTLGALLYIYAGQKGIAQPASSDQLFPLLAREHLGLLVGVFFLLGITASSYASADSALAGLTTAFCIDFLDFKNKPEGVKQRQKLLVHIAFSVLFLVIILAFKEINERSVIDAVLNIAGYTYGPLLGLFSFGLLTRRNAGGPGVLVVSLLAPALSYVLSYYASQAFAYQFGYEILLVNGVITFIGLSLVGKRKPFHR